MSLTNRRTFLVAGGCGFIGKYFIELLLSKGHNVINIDKLSYAADIEFCKKFDEYPNYLFINKDIAEITHLHPCDYLVNFAAESHVDNSILNSNTFIDSNIRGVHNLLQLIRFINPYDRPLLCHVSTDEVYGDIKEREFKESDPLNPSNPYSASKASAELLIKSWNRTYGINYLVFRPSNNYGSRQYPEKLIPRTIRRLKEGQPALLHGDGTYIRSWTHVLDNIRAILHLIRESPINNIYNISSGFELSNGEVVGKICDFLGMDIKDSSVIQYDTNRPGQDIRYAINSTKLLKTGFAFKASFDKELYNLVQKEEVNWQIY